MIDDIFNRTKPLVLVVDDSHLMRFSLRAFLEKENYDVLEAENGSKALALFKEKKPDIILMDFMMPVIDGPTTCAKVQEMSNGIFTPIIITTSLTDVESVNLAFEAGATDYIAKPINYAVLRQRIKRLIRARYAELQLKKSQAFATSIIDNAIEGIITMDINGIVWYQNPASKATLGYASREILGRNINFIIPELYYKSFDNIDFKDKFNDTDIQIFGVKKNGESIPIDLTVSKFTVSDTVYFTVMFRDITERHQYEEMIKYKALYDPLTDLPNRLLLKERMILHISQAKDSIFKLGVLYLDLDRFKLINDTLGHDTGDKLLKSVSERLKQCVKDECTVSRIGGDEYVILVPNITSSDALGVLSERILNSIREAFLIDDHEIYLSVSIGITVFPDDGDNDEILLTNADIAMYRAKEKGKNNFQIYTPALNAKALERLALENSLRRALDYNEFVLHYQPKVDSGGDKIIGMEALIRWHHPNKGLIMPDEFISLAEETGLIVPIGEWVLRTACAHNKSLQDFGLPPITVAVNLSARQFELQDFKKTVTRILAETRMDPYYLELEITESIAMKNVEHTLKVINELIDIGVLFSIDDFGTGYSSLSQLNNFAVNKLKIDRSFIGKIDGSDDSNIMASTILALGKSLDLGIVAEGVETEDQVKFLKDNLCDEMQGYFFARPMDGNNFTDYYSKKHLSTL